MPATRLAQATARVGVHASRHGSNFCDRRGLLATVAAICALAHRRNTERG
ncbi:MAG: hypothetical protein AW07_02672 [Candidatus Accumulibacter sp. SK-11]|nr:MAG: hypothetical protein AW07_02672 [Candidatus Accumulibacter sp. SK-11]